MYSIIFCLISSFVITCFLTPEIIQVAHANEYHDQPNERKIHQHKVPRFGGIAIFFGFVISMLVWSFIQNQFVNIQYFAAALTGVFLIGVRDDFMPLSPTIKLVVETIATCLIMFLGDIRFTSLYGFLGIYEINEYWSYATTLLTVIVVTNAFNLIDGIDGLAGTISIVIFAFFGIWFFMNHNVTNAIICFSIIGALIGFLIYNYRTHIFMGDSGSLILGFTAATMTISFLNQNAVMKETHFLHFASPVSLVSCLLVYPLFDTLRVFIIRLLERRSPFSPDRNHLHHLLLSAKLSHIKATWIVSGVNILFIIFAILTDGKNDNFLIPIIVFMAFLFSLLLKVIVHKVNDKERNIDSASDNKISHLQINKQME
ncbi:MAG: undecaprenyl/decaprenyl-phosphate alpha-N-acetylglucosaminyl 1-phosphate transferase [Thermoflexibacter sp.]|jgi:UDP-N-acetylmuramyl pentapeptide phosphotransferase/UDP-N-acetylglucosamine-1-phosphate transferase|nr:undecaprenyl/decaprenyl-phosphate alpha-N-acetylglucosaminyl 1-phosphate transferase [Thermoflexibacter sp.]